MSTNELLTELDLNKAQTLWCRTSVQRITLPLALNSEPWKILTLVMDSMDLPSMGLMTLMSRKMKTQCVSEAMKQGNVLL